MLMNIFLFADANIVVMYIFFEEFLLFWIVAALIGPGIASIGDLV